MQAAAPDAAVLGVRDQPGAREHAEVLVDAREGDPERPRQLRNRRFARRQAGENRAPGRIGQGRKQAVEVGSGILNHMVK